MNEWGKEGGGKGRWKEGGRAKEGMRKMGRLGGREGER